MAALPRPNGYATSSWPLPKIEGASIFVRLRLALPSPPAIPICYFGPPSVSLVALRSTPKCGCPNLNPAISRPE
jgi:hypothetical protein